MEKKRVDFRNLNDILKYVKSLSEILLNSGNRHQGTIKLAIYAIF